MHFSFTASSKDRSQSCGNWNNNVRRTRRDVANWTALQPTWTFIKFSFHAPCLLFQKMWHEQFVSGTYLYRFGLYGTSVNNVMYVAENLPTETAQSMTRRPASADRTVRRQFQATGQPLSRTQASDAMTSRPPRYEAKCVQRRCFQCGSVPMRSDIKGTELPLPIYW